MAFGAVSLKSHTAKNSCTYGHCDVLMLAIEILNYIGGKNPFPTPKRLLESLYDSGLRVLHSTNHTDRWDVIIVYEFII